jgi:hypothetical protein
MREVLVVALVLVCPLMMIWMMRGHGHGHGHGTGDHDHRRRNDYRAASTDELRRQRDELERTIAEREQFGRFSGQSERDSTATSATARRA